MINSCCLIHFQCSNIDYTPIGWPKRYEVCLVTNNLEINPTSRSVCWMWNDSLIFPCIRFISAILLNAKYISKWRNRFPWKTMCITGGNTSSNPQVPALTPWPAFNGMERMCQRHGSNQNSNPPVLVRKPLCNQFIHNQISSRGVFGINHFKLHNSTAVAKE